MDDWLVTVEECGCKCGCGENGINIEFLRKINMARNLANTPFNIGSGYRCEVHNKNVGGVPTSAHTKGLALDINCNSSRDRYNILQSLLSVGINRIGIAKTFIHVDDDPAKDQNVIWLYT